MNQESHRWLIPVSVEHRLWMKITSVLFLLMLSYSIPEAVVSPDFLTEFVVIVFSSRDHHHLMHALFRLNPLFMRSNSRLELSNFLSMKSLFPANFLCESLTKHDFVVVGKTWRRSFLCVTWKQGPLRLIILVDEKVGKENNDEKNVSERLVLFVVKLLFHDNEVDLKLKVTLVCDSHSWIMNRGLKKEFLYSFHYLA